MATLTSPKEKETYAFIPPPPLPEFYSTKKGDDDGSSSSSASADPVKAKKKVKTKVASKQSTLQQVTSYLPTTGVTSGALVVSGKLPPAPGDATDERMFRTKVVRTTSDPVIIPPPRQDDVPPLACYHICRICLRPRSQRYHREHPIVINGALPPPGICRRCRVAPVQELKTCADVVAVGESNPMRIGVAAFVPEEDIVSNKEMREMRGRRLLRSVSRRRLREDSRSTDTGETREIIYRHVKIRESTQSPPRKTAARVSQTAQDAIGRATSYRGEARVTSATVAKKSSPRTDEWPAPVGAGITQPPPVQKTSRPEPTVIAAAASAASSSPSRSKARATAVVATQSKPERTEAEIRKIAREEVERYRAAERKLEAHPDPYAHGRMIPVERRIEQVADKPETLPWDRKVEKVEVVVSREVGRDKDRQSQMGRPFESSPAPSRRSQGTAKSTRSHATGRASRPEDDLEREISVERVSRSGSKKAGSTYTSGSGWASIEPARTDDPPPKTNIAEPRSTRSDIRKWDLISDLAEIRDQRQADDSEARGYDQRPMVYRGQGVWVPTPPPPRGYDVIEVYRTVSDDDGPTRRGPEIPDRIQELKDDSDRSERAKKHASPSGDRPASDWSKPTDRDYWYDSGVVQTESQHSSRRNDEGTRYPRSEAGDDQTRWSQSLAEPKARTSESNAGRSERRSAPPDQDSQSSQAKPRAFDLRWAAARNRHNGSRASARHEELAERRENEDMPIGNARARPPPSASSASRKPVTKSPEREYIYTERTVQPARESRMCNDGLHRFYTEEEIYHSRKAPKAASAAQEPQTRPQRREKREQQVDVKAKAGGSDYSSARVRFASKIEISPTPPGSDASSHQFRDIGGRARSRRPLDGERPEDLIAEYERRGRARARDARDRASAHEDADSQYEQKRAESWGADGVSEPSRRSEPVSRASKGNETRPLEQAFSESPSRELSPDKADGFGPYRPEQPRGASMDPQSGSGHGRSRVAAWNDGYVDDRSAAYAAGFSVGHAEGRPKGYAEGLPTGNTEGHPAGYVQGWQDATSGGSGW